MITAATAQAVFVSTNDDGHNVDFVLPSCECASKVYFRNWLFQAKSNKITSKNKKENYSKQANRGKDNHSLKEKNQQSTKVPFRKIVNVTQLCPQDYLDAMITRRGYSTRRYMTLNTAYYNKPTPLQKASYSKYMISILQTCNAKKLDTLLSSGLSSNPCNHLGESLLHWICRHGDITLLQILFKHGADVRVADDCGRTPLHDVCRSSNPSLDVFRCLVDRDHHLLYMQDKYGNLPLSYIRLEHWVEWNQYISQLVDVYWPIVQRRLFVHVAIDDADDGIIPTLAFQRPNSRPIPDPPYALPIEFAEMVASGCLEPRDAKSFLRQCGHKRRPLSNTEQNNNSSNGQDDDDHDDDEDSTNTPLVSHPDPSKEVPIEIAEMAPSADCLELRNAMNLFGPCGFTMYEEDCPSNNTRSTEDNSSIGIDDDVENYEYTSWKTENDDEESMMSVNEEELEELLALHATLFGR